MTIPNTFTLSTNRASFRVDVQNTGQTKTCQCTYYFPNYSFFKTLIITLSVIIKIVSVIDKFDFLFSENGLVAKKKGVEIARTVSIIRGCYITDVVSNSILTLKAYRIL